MSGKKSLNPQQVEAVAHDSGPLLIIAGAGTGKTTVITERIVHLILQKHVPPSNILALTFTEKAALEMEERIDVALPLGYTQLWIETFHAFCDRILRQEALHIGLDPHYILLTEAEAILFLRKNLFALSLDYFRPLGNPTKFVQAILQHFSRLKDEDISPQEYIAYAKQMKKETRKKHENEEYLLEQKKTLELANAYKSYNDLKIKEGVLDFSDLIANTLKLFRIRKNILSAYQNKFQYILVDEFQDTNFAQNQLTLLLAGDKKNITVVGDDDQSIYRFRGSSISNMIQFKKNFPKAKIVTLTKNYRSTQTILDSAYQLIQYNNPDRLEVTENIDKKLTALRNIKGKPVELIYKNRGDNEADAVIKKIEELKEEKKYLYKDFAILVRANDYALPFIHSMERHAIPYQFLGPGKLFHEEEIKNLIAYLKVLVNFEDSSALYRILTLSIFTIDATTVALILNIAKKKNLSLFEVIANPSNLPVNEHVKENLAKIVGIIKKHLALIPTYSAGQILYFFLQDTGMLKQMAKATSSQDEKTAQNIARFFEKIKVYETQHQDNSITNVIDWIDLSMQMGESPLASGNQWQENDAVNILTIHASKGLEFPTVFLVNLVKDRFPSRQRGEQIPIPESLIKEILPLGDYHLEEERRLFYVGITRARDLLFLTAAHFYGEGKRERKLSPFVVESLETEILEKIQNEQKQKTNQLSLLESFPKEEHVQSSPVHHTSFTISYLSYSQIQTFDICPLHYKLRYILKIPTPQTAAQAFGISMHQALKDFYQLAMSKTMPSKSQLKDIFKRNWIDEGYTTKEHQTSSFAKGMSMFRKYVAKNFNPDVLPLAIEIPFEFSIDKLRIGGRIDRIDAIGNKTIEIIDYKTGSIPSEKELKNNLQLTTYALAATTIQESMFKKTPDNVLLSLYYLDEGKKLTTTRTKKQLEEARSFYIKKAEEIAGSDFACTKSIFCQNCEYKMICNAR